MHERHATSFHRRRWFVSEDWFLFCVAVAARGLWHQLVSASLRRRSKNSDGPIPIRQFIFSGRVLRERLSQLSLWVRIQSIRLLGVALRDSAPYSFPARENDSLIRAFGGAQRHDRF
jgi:hypothetical protein